MNSIVSTIWDLKYVKCLFFLNLCWPLFNFSENIFYHKILSLPPVNLRSINKSKFSRLIWEYYEGTTHVHICIVNHRQYHLFMAVEQELANYVLWARSDSVSGAKNAFYIFEWLEIKSDWYFMIPEIYMKFKFQHSHTHLVIYCLQLLSWYNGRVE